MFYRLTDCISYANWKEHCQEVNKIIRMLPKGISTKLIVENGELKQQIYYLDDETNFFVSKGGKIFYLESEYNLMAEMTFSDIVTDYNKFLEDDKNS